MNIVTQDGFRTYSVFEVRLVSHSNTMFSKEI